jgi:hypothetical protein
MFVALFLLTLFLPPLTPFIPSLISTGKSYGEAAVQFETAIAEPVSPTSQKKTTTFSQRPEGRRRLATPIAVFLGSFSTTLK